MCENEHNRILFPSDGIERSHFTETIMRIAKSDNGKYVTLCDNEQANCQKFRILIFNHLSRAVDKTRVDNEM